MTATETTTEAETNTVCSMRVCTKYKTKKTKHKGVAYKCKYIQRENIRNKTQMTATTTAVKSIVIQDTAVYACNVFKHTYMTCFLNIQL